jgi:hypothetical protein
MGLSHPEGLALFHVVHKSAPFIFQASEYGKERKNAQDCTFHWQFTTIGGNLAVHSCKGSWEQ